MSDPVSELKRELLAAAERQHGHALSARKSHRRSLLRSGVSQAHPRRRVLALVAAALVVVVGTASAFGTVRDLVVEPFAHGRVVSRTVKGVQFSLSVPRSGWENGPDERIGGTPTSGEFRDGSLFISKSTVGPQDAEAVIFWAGFHGGGKATPCAKVLSPAPRGSTADLAAALARAPGTKILSGPTRVSIGGRPATHMVLTVRKDVGCDPGFFFTWRPRAPHGECWGACWLASNAGDTIRVWIVDVDGKRLLIEAETAKQAGHDVEKEIAKIVGSIRFD
jgi:hypothetical protein